MCTLCRVVESFVCGDCMGLMTGVERMDVDVGVSANLELVDGFCYFCGMLNVGRGSGVAMGTGARVGWSGFRQLVLLLINKDISSIVRGRLYSSCV